MAHSEPPGLKIELKQTATSPVTNPNNSFKRSEPPGAHSPPAQIISTTSQPHSFEIHPANGNHSISTIKLNLYSSNSPLLVKGFASILPETFHRMLRMVAEPIDLVLPELVT